MLLLLVLLPTLPFSSAGKRRLKELGISVVYDLRSDTEIEKYDTPCPTIDGVDVVRVPVFKHEDYTPEMMAKCVSSKSAHTEQPARPHTPYSVRRFELYASGKTEVPNLPSIPVYTRAHPYTGIHGTLLTNTRTWRQRVRCYIPPCEGSPRERVHVPLHRSANLTTSLVVV